MTMYSFGAVPTNQRDDSGSPDLARAFWSLAIPACLMFWAALGYVIWFI
jgi:hypothetical protein